MARVSSTTSSQVLAAANSIRGELIVFNDDANMLYINYGAAASATDYVWGIPQNTGISITNFTGALHGVWAADGPGGAQVTERNA